MSFVAKQITTRIDPATFLDNFGLDDIYTPENFVGMKYAAFYFIDNRDLEGAAAFAAKLEHILSVASPKTAEQKPVFDLAVFWMLRLKLFVFSNLTLGEQLDIIKNHAVDIFKNQLDLRAAIFGYIDLFTSGGIIEEASKNYLSAMLTSPQILGSKVNSQVFRPTVGGWISSYQSSINKRGVRNIGPESFDVLSFLNNDPNTKFLSSDEKEILKEILALYNWLLSPIVYEDTLKQRSNAGQENPYIKSQKFDLPEEAMQGKLPPKTPQAPNSKVAQVMDEIRKPQAQPAPQQKEKAFGNDSAEEVLQRLKQAAPQQEAGLPPVRPVNIQDILNSKGGLDGHRPGLSIGNMQFGGGGSQAPASKPPISQPQPLNQKEDEINKKLEELKKKMGK